MSLSQYFLSAGLALIAATLPLATAAPLLLDTPARPIPPTQDPFYTAPPAFECAPPGSILRVRRAPGNITDIVANSSAAYNILYRTTDSHYKPTWAVTTLYVPVSVLREPVLLSYLDAYDSVNLDSSPSYGIYTGDMSSPGQIAMGLSRGWFVNVPDYEGPLAAWVAGVQSGHAVLDSVRAVLNAELGLHENTRHAVWGYSGGGLAAAWAAELQVQYAPELTFAGAVIGAAPVNASNVALAVNKKVLSGVIPGALLGLTVQFPEAREKLISHLKLTGPFNSTGFLAVQKMGFVQALTTYGGIDVFAFFDIGDGVLREPSFVKAVQSDGVLGYHGVPQWPLFVHNAIGDDLTPIADTDALVKKFCEIGANIHYQRNTEGDHLKEGIVGTPRALVFLQSVLGGTYSHGGCTVEDVAFALPATPRALAS